MTIFTPDELSWLHTILEGHAEVCEDNGDDAEANRLLTMVCDNPVISPADAAWLIEELRDFDDDEVAAHTLQAKLTALLGMTTDNTAAIRIWDAIYGFWIEIDLVHAIEVAREAYRKLKAEKCI